MSFLSVLTSLFLGLFGATALWWVAPIGSEVTWQRLAAVTHIVAAMTLAELAVKFGWIMQP